MDTEALIGPEIKVFATYPLINDRIFTNEPTTLDMVSTAGFNIPTGSRFYLYEDSPYSPSLFVGAGYFSSFDLNDKTATFILDKYARPEIKKIIEDIISNPNDYELFAKISIRITKNGHVKFNKRGESFFFLKNKKYIISKEDQQRIVADINLLWYRKRDR
jgi:hypothetical protein